MENHYIAQKGFTFKRKVDNYIMGPELYLYNFIDGTPDKIENYEEVELPKEETENPEEGESTGEVPTPENPETENEG
jgi:hypothetical protein